MKPSLRHEVKGQGVGWLCEAMLILNFGLIALHEAQKRVHSVVFGVDERSFKKSILLEGVPMRWKMSTPPDLLRRPANQFTPLDQGAVSAPAEMLAPGLCAWVVERHQLAGLRVRCRELPALLLVAGLV